MRVTVDVRTAAGDPMPMKTNEGRHENPIRNYRLPSVVPNGFEVRRAEYPIFRRCVSVPVEVDQVQVPEFGYIVRSGDDGDGIVGAQVGKSGAHCQVEIKGYDARQGAFN